MQPALLPEATIDCFWSQNYTADLFKALQQDWRFARINLQLDKGDIDDAIARYKKTASPSLLIIETDRADDAFMQRLGALATSCTDETAAIFVGPDKDKDFIRHLKTLGVADYWVRPVDVDKASQSVAKILTGRLGVGQSYLTAVVGSKGGVGVTRLAQALGQSLVQFLHEKAALIDPSPSNSPLIMAYGIAQPATIGALDTALQKGQDPNVLNDVLQSVLPDFKVLAMRQDLADPPGGWTHQEADALLRLLQMREANIVADVSQSDAAIRKTILNAADAIVLVTTAEPQALHNAQAMVRDMQDHYPDRPLFLIVNKTNLMQDAEATEQDITETLGMEPFTMIPFAADIFTQIETAQPSTIVKAIQPIAEFLAPLAAAIAGKPAVPLKTSLAVGGTGSLLKLLGNTKK